MKQQAIVDHIFRREYGLLVASLLSRVGVQCLDSVEDAVQYAMSQALDSWTRNTIPEFPTAWMYQVAYRALMSEFRNSKRRKELLEKQFLLEDQRFEESNEVLTGEMNDSLLRLLFITCHDAVPVESQLVFTLKSLCGFSVNDIALRLFMSEANVYKRFSRAKHYLKKETVELEQLSNSEMSTRLPMVLRVLYLVFTEGHLSSHSDFAIRKDLCDEAIRLALFLSKSTVGDVPETLALLALMYLHLAKINTRQDDVGSLLLLEQQDRSQWNTNDLTMGLSYLEQSAKGATLSRYHVEANIVAEHCLAYSFHQTRWDKIVESYELLERIEPSILHPLNRAIAIAEWKGPKAGLDVLLSIETPTLLNHSYHWYAVLADLQYRSGAIDLANKNAKQALQTAPTKSIKQLLQKRFERYGFC